MASLYESVASQLRKLPEGTRGANVFVRLLASLDELIAAKRSEFNRVLPIGDYLVDRWDKARLLGFGEGSSVYDSCLVFGDVVAGKHTWVGPFTILDGSGGLRIGDHCTFSAGVHVYTHDSVETTLRDAPIRRQAVSIGHRVYIGPHAVIACGVSIGDCAVIGAGSVVLHDVPANTKVAGSPARVIGEVPAAGEASASASASAR